jgi:putative ABC transport system permease protein
MKFDLHDSLLREIRVAFRSHKRSAGTSLIIILTLGIGIGSNAAIFSAVDSILIRPLPYSESDRLVRIETSQRYANAIDSTEGLSIAAVQDITSQCSAFEQLASYSAYSGATIRGSGFPDFVSAPKVSGSFFTLLGVAPLLGRFIVPSDTTPQSEPTAVLSYGAWLEDFGGDPAIVNKTVTLDYKPYTVIGVMPSQITLGIGKRGVWLPLVVKSNGAFDRSRRSYFVLARLKRNATVKEANSQLGVLAGRLATAYPQTDAGWKLIAGSIKGNLVRDVRPGLVVLLGAVSFVLLISCLNVSVLLQERSISRSREIVIRQALGGTRTQLFRQFFIEGLILSVLGGGLGLLIAIWGVRVIQVIAPENTPRLDLLSVNATVLWFVLAICIMCALLFSLGPANHLVGSEKTRSIMNDQKSVRSGTSTNRHKRLRTVLVISEIALALVLSIGAVLMSRSLSKLTNVNLGFRTDHIVTMSFQLGKPVCDFKNPSGCRAALQDILGRAQSVSGVEHAAIASNVPLSGSMATDSLSVKGSEGVAVVRSGIIWYRTVSPDYFGTMGIPLLSGRTFADNDRQESESVAIVNDAFARKFLSDSPIGKEIAVEKGTNGSPEWMRVIGLVKDTRDIELTTAPAPQFYCPTAQKAIGGASLIVRTATNPSVLLAPLKKQIWSVDKNSPILNTLTMDQIVATRISDRHFQTVLLDTFGLVGILLAACGIYGALSFAVRERTHEIGVRIALGARRYDVLRMVIREGMVLAGIGIIVGLGGSLGLTRLLRSALFEVNPIDPVTLVIAPILVALIALTACLVPSLRATRIDPAIALRYE